VKDLFVTDGVVGGASAARFVFGRDGKIYLAIGISIPIDRPGYATVTDAQNPASRFGKVLRLNDDGSAPPDNPFVGRPGYKPEIYALGIRNAMGIVVHPQTGEIWENENGPQGGDEINVIRRGLNYGWPIVSYGRAYTGELVGSSGPSSHAPFRRVNVGELEVEITVDDPKAYTQPWTVTVNQRLMPDTQLIEFICHENEKFTKCFAR
jgi:hypothetical protein